MGNGLEKISKQLAKRKPIVIDEAREQERCDMAVRAWEQRFRDDELHAAEIAGHETSLQRRKVIGIACLRKECSCGWTGEWRKDV